MPSRTSSAILSLTSVSAMWSRVHSINERSLGRDIRSLEELALLAVSEVRGVPGKVGQGRWIRDLVDCVDDLPGVAALECGDDQRLVIRREFANLVCVPSRAADLLRLHPEGSARPGDTRTDADPALSSDDRGWFAAGQPAHLHDGRLHAV